MEQNEEGVVQIQPSNASPADIMAQAFAEDDSSSSVTQTETQNTVENESQEPDLEVVDTSNVQESTENNNTVQKNTPDQAFANMRRQVDAYKQQAMQNQQYANIIEEIARNNGVTPQQLIQTYNEQKMSKEAEKQGVPVEVYKELQELKSTVQTLQSKPIEEKFNSQMEKLISTYQLNQDDVQDFFIRSRENGFDLTKVQDLEQVYKFLNINKILNDKEQKRLEQKEKINKQTPLTPQNTTTVVVDEDKEVEQFLKSKGAWNG